MARLQQSWPATATALLLLAAALTAAYVYVLPAAARAIAHALPPSVVVACALFASDGPLVFEVSAGGASLEDQSGPAFFAAPLEVMGEQVRRGEWINRRFTYGASQETMLGPTKR